MPGGQGGDRVEGPKTLGLGWLGSVVALKPFCVLRGAAVQQ
jgi:hypothetical protein